MCVPFLNTFYNISKWFKIPVMRLSHDSAGPEKVKPSSMDTTHEAARATSLAFL